MFAVLDQLLDKQHRAQATIIPEMTRTTLWPRFASTRITMTTSNPLFSLTNATTTCKIVRHCKRKCDKSNNNVLLNTAYFSLLPGTHVLCRWTQTQNLPTRTLEISPPPSPPPLRRESRRSPTTSFSVRSLTLVPVLHQLY